MKKYIHWFILLIVIIVAVILSFSFFQLSNTAQSSESSDSSVNVLTADEYEEKWKELAEERYKEALKKSKKGLLVAHADGITADQIAKQTRYTENFLNSAAATGIGLGIDLAVSTVDVSSVGDNIELRFKSFYETTGKVRLLYQAYVNGKYQTLFTETVTCYCMFLPEGAANWYNGTLTPPTMPNWSLDGIMPNDMCFERQLDTGDTQYFIARFYNPSTQSCYATNYSANNQFGVSFNFNYSTGRVIDSSGTHSFSVPQNRPIRFVSSATNSIDYLHQMQYDPSSLVYSSNLTVSQLQEFYCSYIATNDRPENYNVINENVYKNYTNYDYRKFPIYRVTNKYYQSYDRYSNYETKYYGDTYIDNGITIDGNLKTSIDFDVLATTVSASLQPEFQAVLDAVFDLQPEVGVEFNGTNNVYNYPEIINPQPIVTSVPGGGSSWEPPSYPAVNTSIYIPADVPNYETYAIQTVPDGVLSSARTYMSLSWDLFDGLGLVALVIPLAILGLLWKFTGG